MTLKQKIESFLDLDCPSNYDCWEDAEESILEELSDEECDEYAEQSDISIEEWFIANS